MSKIHDAFGGIDDRIIEEALNIDSASKMKEAIVKEQRKRKMKIFKQISALAACICLCFGAVVIARFLPKSNDNNITRVVSPITYVSSRDEIKQYLGFVLPELSEKKEVTFVLYSTDNQYASKGKIIYSDDSEYCMSRGSGDISGIYGGKLVGATDINSITVYFYEMSGERYAIWNIKGYACCYYAAESETDYSEIIDELIRQIKN